MSKIKSLILESFETLPPGEQHEVLVELLRQTHELPEGFLSDKQLAGLADDLFQTLDAEESDDSIFDARRSNE